MAQTFAQLVKGIAAINAPANSLTIDSSGRVGLGTSSPNTKLSVVGTVGSLAEAIRVNSTAATQSGNSGLWLAGNQSTSHYNWLIASQYNVNAALEITPSTATDGSTFSTPTAVFTQTGRVGIGTTSPSAPLHLSTGATAASALFASTDTTAYSATSFLSSARLRITGGSATSAYNGITFGNNSNAEGFIGFVQNSSGYNDFVIQSYAGSYSEKLRVTSAGNVGIGTTSPAQALSVVGNIIADGSAASQYVASSKAGVTSTYLMTDANGGNIQTDGAWPIRFTINSTERARIDSSGRLLVGTTTPQGTSPHLIQTPQTGTANGANIAGFTIGNSAGEYPSAGYNVRFTGSTTTYQYNGTDYAVMIRYGQSSGRIETFTAASGTGGNTISFTPGPYVANNGGSWTSSSDERLKTDLVPIEDGLNKVATLRSVIGRFKTDEPEKKRAFLIAQDVQKVLPEAVDTVDPNSLGLSYTETIPLLVAALKEAKERIEQLEAKVAVFEGV